MCSRITLLTITHAHHNILGHTTAVLFLQNFVCTKLMQTLHGKDYVAKTHCVLVQYSIPKPLKKALKSKKSNNVPRGTLLKQKNLLKTILFFCQDLCFSHHFTALSILIYIFLLVFYSTLVEIFQH